MPIWLRVSIGLAVFLMVCGMFVWFCGIQSVCIWEIHRAAQREPAIWIKPIQLGDLSVSQTRGKTLSYFGYEFEVPWSDIDQDKTKVIGKNKIVVVFRSGNIISFWVAPPNELLNGLFADGSMDRKKFGQIYGDDLIKSDYDFKRSLLDSTPNDVSLFTPRKDAIRKVALITMKQMALVPGSGSGIFLFATREFKGIQYGDPRSGPKYLSVDLFNDSANLKFILGNRMNTRTSILQGELNRVTLSVHELTTHEIGN
jgi:hypothetical protein